MPVAVSTPVFEGPLDLLLQLILKEEVDLYEVSLVLIVDAFVEQIEAINAAVEQGETDRLDLETTTEFLVIAATLVELKSRRLLPIDPGDDLDEALWLWEERDLLLARLIACKTFKNVAGSIEDLLVAGSRTAPRRAGLDERLLQLAPDLLAGIGPDDLARAMARALRPRPEPVVSLHHVTPLTANVTDALVELAGILPHRKAMSFRQITSHLTDRVEIVVRFLAVLELFKEGLVDLEQATSFGELTVRWIGGATADVELVVAGADSYDG